MTRAPRLWPLLTAIHRYDKSLSARGYGRILYDVGCDYGKIADPDRRAHYYDAQTFHDLAFYRTLPPVREWR